MRRFASFINKYIFDWKWLLLSPCNPALILSIRILFVSDFLMFYPDPFSLPKTTLDYFVQFWYLDLSKLIPLCRIVTLFLDQHPHLPSCMLHSYLLALKLKVTSITVWYLMLRESPLYAILSVFSFGNICGIYTFMISSPTFRKMAQTTSLRKTGFPKWNLL